MLPRIQPIAPKRIQAPFDHTEFVYELKMDGWRCLAYIENGACRLVSRKQNQFKSFGPLAASVAKLKVQNASIDGEASLQSSAASWAASRGVRFSMDTM
jgi:bifunctional non-homologous end joining protein LigD